MKFILKYTFISIMITVTDLIKSILDTNYEGWRYKACLPPDLLCLCLEYIVEEKQERARDEFRVLEDTYNNNFNHGFLVDEKKHGPWEEWWYGDNYLHGNYVNGKKEGEWKSWHNNGLLYMYSFYVNGLLHGEWKTFSPNGQPSVQQSYNNGKRVGAMKIWSESGKLEGHIVIDD